MYVNISNYHENVSFFCKSCDALHTTSSFLFSKQFQRQKDFDKASCVIVYHLCLYKWGESTTGALHFNHSNNHYNYIRIINSIV